MKFFTKMMKLFHKFTMVDVGLFKISMASGALLIAKLRPDILSLDRYWYAIVFAVSYTWVIHSLFVK